MQKEIHIVMCQDGQDNLMVGCLPLSMIPKGSNLRDVLFSKGYNEIRCPSGGLLGVYEEKYLAQEHMKIEWQWRSNNHMVTGIKFWIQTIKARKYKRNRES